MGLPTNEAANWMKMSGTPQPRRNASGILPLERKSVSILTRLGGFDLRLNFFCDATV